MNKIFTPFFTIRDDAAGMGLPISRSIIESHDGRLRATDHAGRGATFQFNLHAAIAAHI
jgi:signal transduction histidine kinase